MLAPGFRDGGMEMQSREIRIAAIFALLAVMFAADAAIPRVPDRQVELSMLLKGTIDIAPDGGVERYSLEKSKDLTPAAVGILNKQISRWRFEPVVIDGKPSEARTNMTIRVVASPASDGNYSLVIQGANFSGSKVSTAEKLRIKTRTGIGPLIRVMMSTGATGEVYVALKIGPDGKVQDGVIEQVNLTVLGTDKQMEDARVALGDSSLALVRKWTFSVPTQGESAGKPYWSGVLPIFFDGLDSSGPSQQYGRWRAYVPGPCAAVPWRDPEEGGSNMEHRCEIDALPEGEFTLDSSGPKLLTPLMQG